MVKIPEPKAKMWAVAGPYGLAAWLLILLSFVLGVMALWIENGYGIATSALSAFAIAVRQPAQTTQTGGYKSLNQLQLEH